MLELVPSMTAEFFMALVVELGAPQFKSAHIQMYPKTLDVTVINHRRRCVTQEDEIICDEEVSDKLLMAVLNEWNRIREAEFYWEGGSIHILECRAEVHVRGVTTIPDRTKLLEGRPARLYFVF